MLIVATTYWQTWASSGLAARQDNEIMRVAQFEIRRGTIYAANGKTVLATNVRKKVGGRTLYFRTYPTHGFASQAIGYSTQSRSRAGLEREENSYLTASDKNVGTILSNLGDKLKGATIKGNDLWLNLKPGPQRLAQQLLAGKCGAAVVLNPKTGAVYVMASSPTFDPNLIETPDGYAKIQATKAPCTPSAPLLNRATQGLYPPGSTFKIVTAAAALESGKFTPESTFSDPGYCTEYGKPVYNAGNADADGPESFGIAQLRHRVRALGQRGLLQHRQDARRREGARAGEEVRLLLDAAARDAVRRALRLGAVRRSTGSTTRRIRTRRSTRAGSPSGRSGCS